VRKILFVDQYAGQTDIAVEMRSSKRSSVMLRTIMHRYMKIANDANKIIKKKWHNTEK
jgi:hypothetical protein